MYPTVIITGANGFVGSFLVNYFVEKKWQVRAFARKPIQQQSPLIQYYPFDLANTVEESAFVEADFLIHCAVAKYSVKTPDSDEINIQGTKKLLELSRKHKLKKIIFFSTMSAHREAKSHYGKHKLSLESIFDLEQDVVLKPGLILGPDGGLFSNIRTTIQKSKFIPLIDGGKQPIQTIHIGQLAEAIEVILDKLLAGCFYLGETQAITMKTFYKGIAQAMGVKRSFVFLPSFFVGSILSLVELLRINLSISSENLSGLKALKSFDTQESGEKLGIQFREFKETVQKVMP